MRVRALQFLGATDDSGSSGKAEPRLLAFPIWALFLVVIGSILDVLSTFFPWGVMIFGLPVFLPYSVPLLGGEHPLFLGNDFSVVAINVMVRLASVLGFVGLLVRGRFGNASSNWVQCVSFGLSFASFVVFYQLGLSPALGVYLVFAAGVLKLVGFVGQNVDIALVSEADK